MSTPLLICDDSNMARKQVARSLPDNWEVDISFATNGFEAIAAIKAGKGDVLLLDLNMPEMDGYQVLETIVKEDLPTLTIVISGDIQPSAHERVTKLGALDFIRKPVNKEKLTEILTKYGVMDTSQTVAHEPPKPPSEPAKVQTLIKQGHQAEPEKKLQNDIRDCYQEIANVAMGRAGDLLARLLNVFVMLPIPNVNFIEVSELSMAFKSVEDEAMTSGICQGFIGAGISGEALLILNDSSFKDIAKLMKYPGEVDEKVELELLMDLSNVIVGACLEGISEQLDMRFSQGHPVVLGRHCNISELISSNSDKWKKTLAIEISYGIENYPIKCDLLLLFTEDSMKTLNNKVAYLLD